MVVGRKANRRRDIQGNNRKNQLRGTKGRDRIFGLGGNDTLIGLGGDDLIDGGSGNDVLSGGEGTNTLKGGKGDDRYVVTSASDRLVELANQGTDTVEASVSFTLAVNLENLTLLTGAVSGMGNDSNNVMIGNEADNSLFGLAGDDTLRGEAGNDSIDGGTGNDTLVGGAGNDIYIIDSLQDVVTEAANEGSDRIRLTSAIVGSTAIDLNRYQNIESVEVLNPVGAFDVTGNALNNTIVGNNSRNVLIGNAGDDTLNGFAGDDVLNGDDGNDTLNGGEGADMLSGGAGDDTYFVSNRDTVTEAADAGKDTVVYSSLVGFDIASKLTLSDNIESAEIALGLGSVKLDGNAIDNVISGNDGANILNGLDGDDRIFGGAGEDAIEGGSGNDFLVGGSGINNPNAGFDGVKDTLSGGLGDDVYLVESLTLDVVTEAANGGIDTIGAVSDISIANLINVENIGLIGTNTATATGNTLSNTIAGNIVSNTLEGGAGDDVLIGDLGFSLTTLQPEAATTGAADILVGGTGNDTLIGGFGNDTLTGGTSTSGSGNDRFVFASGVFTGTASVTTVVGGRAFATADFGVDTIANFSSGDEIVLSKTTFTLTTAAGANSLGAADFESVTLDSAVETSAKAIVYSRESGKLFYNQNGATAGLGTGAQFATVNASSGSPVTSLAASAFTVIA